MLKWSIYWLAELNDGKFVRVLGFCKSLEDLFVRQCHISAEARNVELAVVYLGFWRVIIVIFVHLKRRT